MVNVTYDASGSIVAYYGTGPDEEIVYSQSNRADCCLHDAELMPSPLPDPGDIAWGKFFSGFWKEWVLVRTRERLGHALTFAPEPHKQCSLRRLWS